MLTTSLPHGLFRLILYFEGCLGMNFASVVQSGNFIFLSSFFLCRQRLQMQQRRRSKKSICSIITFFGILMFVAQNE